MNINIDGNDNIGLNEISDSVITITSRDLSNQSKIGGFTYKVSPDGLIIKDCDKITTENELIFNKPIVKSSKEIAISELIKEGFEQISENLTEEEFKKILEFSRINIDKTFEYSKMFPFTAEVTSTGDLKTILLMYNGNKDSLTLSKFPFKLRDAKDKVIIVDIIDINKTISPKKIAICEVLIDKERLSEQSPDLSKWTITFELQ